MCVCIQRKKKVPRCRERIIPEHSEGGRLEREDKRWREREREKGLGGRELWEERGRTRQSLLNILSSLISSLLKIGHIYYSFITLHSCHLGLDLGKLILCI